jgi:flagellar basal-body rod protein FlgF
MLRGLYSAASGMVSQLMVMDTMANNLANVNTAGFKQSGVSQQSFSNVLMKQITNGTGSDVGPMNLHNRVYATATNFWLWKAWTAKPATPVMAT